MKLPELKPKTKRVLIVMAFLTVIVLVVAAALTGNLELLINALIKFNK